MIHSLLKSQFESGHYYQFLVNNNQLQIMLTLSKSSLNTCIRTMSANVQQPKKKSLLHTPKYSYHMSYLMDSKHDDRFVKIQRKAFHLYRDLILNFKTQKFNQKTFLIVLIDCVRTKQSYEDFQKLAEHGISRLGQFKQLLSIFTFATQLYLYNYPKKDECLKVAQRGFQLIRLNPIIKYSSYYTMKFLIFIQKNVGLDKFTDAEYQLINFHRFKPLFLCFTMQMFFQNHLEHYPFIQKLLDLFTSDPNLIPFADIHHYKMATKTITDKRFMEFVGQLNKHISDQGNVKIGQDSELQEGDLAPYGNGQNEVGVGVNKNSSVRDHKNNYNNRIDKSTKTSGNLIYQASDFDWQGAYCKEVHRRFTHYPSLIPKPSDKFV